MFSAEKNNRSPFADGSILTINNRNNRKILVGKKSVFTKNGMTPALPL